MLSSGKVTITQSSQKGTYIPESVAVQQFGRAEQGSLGSKLCSRFGVVHEWRHAILNIFWLPSPIVTLFITEASFWILKFNGTSEQWPLVINDHCTNSRSSFGRCNNNPTDNHFNISKHSRLVWTRVQSYKIFAYI